MASLVAALLLAAAPGLVLAQSAIPSNATFRPPTSEEISLFSVSTTMDMTGRRPGLQVDVFPLIQGAYDILPHTSDSADGRNGSVVINTPGNALTSTDIQPWAFAYTSCDEEDYADGQIDLPTTIRNTIDANVSAIVFYSTRSQHCVLINATSYGNFRALYSTVNSSDARSLLEALGDYIVTNNAEIITQTALDNMRNQPTGGFAGAGTTAVAMIILYSITGVITALFLIIIITGAVRAHRHPERYGPRNIIGRPRQSRARGIARAMLDTIPIVKFGEREPPKDVELNEAAASQPNQATNQGETQTSSVPNSSLAAAGVATVPSTTQTTAESSEKPDTITPTTAADEDTQGCSICTDDFERGQDIRVLPCGHQFHPACVDPWLLEVSGTCPLCRVDLNPDAANAGTSDELPPPLNPEAANSPVSGRRRDNLLHFLTGGRGELGGLHGSGREERLAALRRWRAANPREAAPQQADPAPEIASDEQHRSRLGSLSRLMRRR